MRTIDEFKEFYSETLLPDLYQIEKTRKETWAKLFKTTFIYVASIIALMAVGIFINSLIYGEYIADDTANIPLTLSVIISIILLIYLFGANRKLIADYVSEFKLKIIGAILHFIDSGLRYQPLECVNSDAFNKSEIFRLTPNVYGGDDCVSGKIGMTDIVFSEIHAKYRSRSGDSDSKDKETHVFGGLFFVADFHKNFKGKYFIMPDFAEKRFGKLGQALQKFNKSRGQLIQLEDPEFEKLFVVHGSDQVEARYILSSNMMQRLSKFRSNANKSIMISFVNSCIFIAIPYSRPLFEPKFSSSVVDQNKALEYFTDLQLAIGIVEELNLNTRIWGKE